MSTTVSYLDPQDEERIITMKPGDRVSVTQSADRTLSRSHKTGTRATSDPIMTVYKDSSVHMVIAGGQPSYVPLDPSSGQTLFPCNPSSLRVVVDRAGNVSRQREHSDTVFTPERPIWSIRPFILMDLDNPSPAVFLTR